MTKQHSSGPAVTQAGQTAAQSSTVALFVSDVHLQEALPGTTEAFLNFLEQHASKAQVLYLLGDLFEYWAGDDDLATPFNLKIASAFQKVSHSGARIFWIAGNRDFLVAEDFAQEAGLTILPDPFVVTLAGKRFVLTHGDALCTDDVSYMAFRKQVRNKEWQQSFLAKPLEERKCIIAGLRKGSKEAQRTKMADIMDANEHAVSELFHQSETSLMIHGHTHRPACHMQQKDGTQFVRWVLPDWDCDNMPHRGGWIAVESDGDVRRYDVNGQPLE